MAQHDSGNRRIGRRGAIALAGLFAGMMSAALVSHIAAPPAPYSVRVAI